MFCPICGKPWVKHDTGREGCETFNCPNYHALEKESRVIAPGYRTTRGRVAGGHIIETKSQWTYGQKALANSMGLKEVVKYLGRFCQICGKPAPRHSHLDLCKDHKKLYQDELHKQRQKKYREKHR